MNKNVNKYIKSKISRDFTKIKFLFFMALAVGIVCVALFADLIVPFDPYAQNLTEALQAPSSSHILGTDRYGRDMLSRVIMGARITVFSTLALVLLISVFGTIIGLFCGYYGGKLDSIIMRLSDVFLAFPGIVFAIAVAGVMGGGMINAVIALAVTSWPKYARIARGQVLIVKEMPYIAASKLSGSSTTKIMFNHIMPTIAGPILVTAMLDIGTMMMELAGLSFLGLGVQPPAAEWGSMMSNGRSMIQTSPWVVLGPGFAIFMTVAIFNLLGDTIRDLLDPRRNQV